MKTRKPLSTKIPPVPDESHQVIDDWIADIRPALVPLVSTLDSMIREEISDARYAIKWSNAFYGSPANGWTIELAAYLKSVNIVFLNGDQLEKPPELGGDTRYVKLRRIEEIDELGVSDWIRQSANLPGWEWE